MDAIRSIGGLTIGADDTLQFNNGQDLTVFGATIANDGTIFMSSTGGGTDLRIDGASTTLNGMGSLTLGGAVNNRVFGNSTGLEILVNSATHSIQGGGSFSDLQLTNQGMIDANSAGNVLSFASTAPITNTGTLMASMGGTLRLASAVANAGGLIKAENMSTVEFSGPASIVDGGSLETTGSGVILLTGGGVPVLRDVTMNGLVRLPNGQDVGLEGMITNSNTFEQNSTGGATDVRIRGDVTVTGNGTWRMTDNVNNRVFGNATSAEVLTNAASHTIEGAGTFSDLGAVINNGTISATQPNALTFAATAPVANTGVLKAAGGGTLRLASPTANAGGLIKAEDMSTVEISGGSAMVDGGTLETAGSGVVRLAGGGRPVLRNVTMNGLVRLPNGLASQLTNNGGNLEAEDASTVEIVSSGAIMDGVTFTTSGSGVVLLAGGGRPVLRNVTMNGLVRLPNGQDTVFEGAITNNGNTFEQNSAGGGTDVRIGGDVTVTGNGTWRMTDNVNNRIFGNATSAEVLTNDTDHTIEGAGTFSSLGFINRGLVHANVTNALSITPSDVDVDGAGADMLNEMDGVLRASGDGELRLSSGTFANRDGGQVRVESTIAVIAGGLLDNQPGGIVLGDGTLDVSAGSFVNGGTVSPGLSAGILTVIGDVPQTATGSLLIELEGTTLGNQYDQLAVDGDVMLDGSLDVLLSFAPELTDDFIVVEAGFNASNAVTGEFMNAPRTNPVLNIPEGSFDVLYNPQSVVLTNFVPIPEPSATLLALFGLLIGAHRVRRATR